jgi:O-antigen/teichoic acid export membrane protein
MWAVLSFAQLQSVALALVALAIASPFILFLWLMRRRCYVQGAPRLAATAGLLYMILLIGGAYVMFGAGWLSSPAALLLMGVCSIAPAYWIRSRLSAGALEWSQGFSRDVVAQHWTYGRWAVGTGLLGGLVLNAYYLVMPAAHGLESAAELRALTNLVMPATQTFWALSVVALPALVRVRDTPAFMAWVWKLAGVYGIASIGYWLILGLSHRFLVEGLYGGQYLMESHLLWVLGSFPIASGGVNILECALRAHERSYLVFRAFALAALSACVVGIPAALQWGIPGAILGLLLSFWIALVAMCWSLRAVLRDASRRSPAVAQS